MHAAHIRFATGASWSSVEISASERAGDARARALDVAVHEFEEELRRAADGRLDLRVGYRRHERWARR